MKFLIIFSMVIVAAMGQKPFYAGGDSTYPKLASRFQGRDEQDQNQNTINNIQPSQPVSGTGVAAVGPPIPWIPPFGTNTNVDLGNRIGETQTTSSTVAPQTSRATTTTTERIPIDALGDMDLINRIKTWPREKQPFWYLNAQHIEASRNRTVQQMPTIQSRGSFLPSTF